MARTFKISFPLPRRPSASPNTTPGSGYSSQNNVDDSPLSHPGSKAERTLGFSDPDTSRLKNKMSRKARRQLRKYPSFISVALSEIDGESVRTPDGFPFVGLHGTRETSRRSTQNLNRQGSSPFLGEQYFTPNEFPEADNLSNHSARQAYRTSSFTTLGSYYDPAKSPLSVSQQTSASSARDMALRKGMSPISSPWMSHSASTVKSAEPGKFHSRNLSADSRVSASSKLEADSMKRINGLPKRRPSVIDRPTLYPKAEKPCHAVSQPPALISSSLPKPLPNSQQPTSFSRPRGWQMKTPPTSPETPLDDQQGSEQPFEESFSSTKVNVKRPKPAIKGERNWFDGLEDEEQTLEDLQHPEVVNRSTVEKPERPMSLYEIMAQEPRPSQITSRKSSFSNKSQHTAPSDCKLSFRLDSATSRRLHTVPTGPSNGLRSHSSSLSPQTTPSSKAHAGMDLQVNSFLELSSSDDDGAESSAPSEAQTPYRRHRIRASIERAIYNSEVSVGNARCAQPVRPRSIVNRLSGMPSSGRSNSSEIVPPVPSIPTSLNWPEAGQRTPSMRWRETIEDKAASTESTADSGESSLNGSRGAREPHPRIKRKGSIRGSKLMKVTQEEEKLLEAMRDKRASIRKDDFEKGFKTAMQLQDIVARPKTAGADGRNSAANSRSSVYGSRSSISPVPTQEYGNKRILTCSRLSASADDLISEDAYPFPEVPPSLKSPADFASIPKASPSLSFSPSDILPSTPGSRNSPITPPPDHATLGLYSRGSTLSPGRGVQVMNKLGHERKRTLSSSVVMLDGVEHHAQELDEENEISHWAMDRW